MSLEQTNPELFGWIGATRKDLLQDFFAILPDDRKQFVLKGDDGRSYDGVRAMLWEVVRKVLGKDTENFAQLIGDCTSFGCKNCLEYVQATDIARGVFETWKPIFPPYCYGAGRVLTGNDPRDWGDGAVASWLADGVTKFGSISRIDNNCPPYSAKVAKQWGYSGPPKEFVVIGKQHLAQPPTLVRTWDDVLRALANGYPISIASNVGFDMQARSDGFMHRSGHWNHNMSLVGVDDSSNDPYGCILNSWADAHGHIIDFVTKEQWPIGTLRVRKNDIIAIIEQGDSWAYPGFNGFEAGSLPPDFFNVM